MAAASSTDFEHRLNSAIDIACMCSGFSAFHNSYPPLFKKLWRTVDPGETGKISAADAEVFAQRMVESGWQDWEPSDRDRETWAYLEKRHGGVELEAFAEASENAKFLDEARARDEKLAGGHGKAHRSKVEAGRRMAASHEQRMSSFDLPSESQTAKRSTQCPAHCTDCEMQPMLQHVYCGSCKYCAMAGAGGATTSQDPFSSSSRLMDYMCMCDGCALKLGRCCGCGRKLQ